MGFLSDLFGQKEQQKQRTSGRSRITAANFGVKEEDFRDRLAAMGSKTTRRGSDYSRAINDAGLKRLESDYLSFDTTAAKRDARGAVEATLARVLNAGLGDIQSGNTTAGGYNSTATKLLEDNLRAQAAAAGAEVELNTINNYANIQRGIAQDVANLIQVSQSGVEDILDQTTQDQFSSSRQSAQETSNQDTTEEGTVVGSGKTSPGLGSIIQSFFK